MGIKRVKEMTIDDIWSECISIWGWICKELKDGENSSIDELKHQWLQEHGYKQILWGCFFCSWAKRHPKIGNERYVNLWCREADNMGCPGTLVDEDFYCERMGKDYKSNPHEFLKELRRLNKLRKARMRRATRKK